MIIFSHIEVIQSLIFMIQGHNMFFFFFACHVHGSVLIFFCFFVFFSVECIVQNEGLDKEWTEEDEVERKVLVNKEATQAEEMLVWREACYTALERHAEDATVQVTCFSLQCGKDHQR